MTNIVRAKSDRIVSSSDAISASANESHESSMGFWSDAYGSFTNELKSQANVAIQLSNQIFKSQISEYELSKVDDPSSGLLSFSANFIGQASAMVVEFYALKNIGGAIGSAFKRTDGSILAEADRLEENRLVQNRHVFPPLSEKPIPANDNILKHANDNQIAMPQMQKKAVGYYDVAQPINFREVTENGGRSFETGNEVRLSANSNHRTNVDQLHSQEMREQNILRNSPEDRTFAKLAKEKADLTSAEATARLAVEDRNIERLRELFPKDEADKLIERMPRTLLYEPDVTKALSERSASELSKLGLGDKSIKTIELSLEKIGLALREEDINPMAIFGARTCNLLAKRSIRSIDALCTKSASELGRIPGMGPTHLATIVKELELMGKRLKLD